MSRAVVSLFGVLCGPYADVGMLARADEDQREGDAEQHRCDAYAGEGTMPAGRRGGCGRCLRLFGRVVERNVDHRFRIHVRM